MKKIGILIAGIALLVVSNPAFAKGPSAQAGKSDTAHLYLYQKDPSDWSIVSEGAWGKMKYGLTGPEFDFVFNGHNLVPETDYTLIYYPDPWPGTGLMCLANGVTNGGGNLNLQANVDTGSLPIVSDANYKWNLDGVWGLNFNSTLYPAGNAYAHNVTIAGDNATGSSTGNTYTATVSVTGNSVTIVATYSLGSAAYPYSYTAIGTISATGTLTGTWTGSDGDSGSWASTSGIGTLSSGAKIWLVNSADVNCTDKVMIGWNPTSYLFEEVLINYTP